MRDTQVHNTKFYTQMKSGERTAVCRSNARHESSWGYFGGPPTPPTDKLNDHEELHKSTQASSVEAHPIIARLPSSTSPSSQHSSIKAPTMDLTHSPALQRNRALRRVAAAATKAGRDTGNYGSGTQFKRRLEGPLHCTLMLAQKNSSWISN